MFNARPPFSRRSIQILTLACLFMLALAYAIILVRAAPDWPGIASLWPVSLVGLAGALVANSTGVGGGVVFVPVFSALRESGILELGAAQTIGVSFSIQCFGMSMGALTWLNRYYRRNIGPDEIAHRPVVGRTVILSLVTGLPALLATQHLADIDSALAFLMFKLFSIALGLALLAQIVILRGAQAKRERLSLNDQALIAVIGVVGGSATALFSVGIGELLALTLFLRRFPVDICVSSAVIVSAIAVWAGSVHHLDAGHLEWGVLVFAAPAVAAGGFLARRMAHALGALRLKLMTAIWIIGSSSALLVI